MSRLSPFIRGLVTAVAIVTAGTAHAQLKWRIAGTFAPTHSTSQAMEFFKRELVESTTGKMDVDLFTDMQLATAAESVRVVRAGTVEMSYVGIAFLSRTVPEMEAISLPFQFASRDQAFRVVDGPVGKLLDARMADKGLILLGFMELGARHVANSKRPIRSLEDMRGLKIRLQPNETHLATFRAMGTNPITMDSKELFSALEQGVVDGHENPFAIFQASRIYEVQKYTTATGHFFDFIAVFANRKAFLALPPDLQKAVRTSMTRTVTYQRERARLQEADAMAFIQKAGMQVETPTPAFAADMRKVVQPVIEEVRKRVGPELVDKVQAEVAKAK